MRDFVKSENVDAAGTRRRYVNEELDAAIRLYREKLGVPSRITRDASHVAAPELTGADFFSEFDQVPVSPLEDEGALFILNVILH